MGATVYQATFPDGTVLQRTSGRSYDWAWLVKFTRADGTTGQDQGFSRSRVLANEAAHGIQRRLGTRGYRIDSLNVVGTLVLRETQAKPRRTFVATFPDGQIMRREAAVNYTAAWRVRYTLGGREGWVGALAFSQAAAEAAAAEVVRRHGDIGQIIGTDVVAATVEA